MQFLNLTCVTCISDHMYYHKWAVLVNPKEASDGAKGYIKCDITVLGKGDVARAPKHDVKDDDSQNIERYEKPQ